MHSRNRPTATDDKNLLSLRYDVSGLYYFGKIIKIVATIRCRILKLRCTKFDFEWGCSSDPAGEAYSAPSDPLAGFKGPTSIRGRRGGKGKCREGKKGERGGEVKGWGVDIALPEL